VEKTKYQQGCFSLSFLLQLPSARPAIGPEKIANAMIETSKENLRLQTELAVAKEKIKELLEKQSKSHISMPGSRLKKDSQMGKQPNKANVADPKSRAAD